MAPELPSDLEHVQVLCITKDLNFLWLSSSFLRNVFTALFKAAVNKAYLGAQSQMFLPFV